CATTAPSYSSGWYSITNYGLDSW
nr:immunoglobulin heavy chain junction region [Macaca mulatta]MOW88550.1 immunoglobulin heavy chain junction region [Macaca mulatta]MOW89749.1 immunoglobulin heavy chain junction region [Macaca mulatta]MOW90700.1 immunoglobulin heavy chain junction region [Macaca mulatta]MOW93251.1 immunoglobulin heavy chain junction region [Macaca mulatta]